MTIELTTAGETYTNTAAVSDTPAVRITANGVTLVNQGALASGGTATAAVVVTGSGAIVDNRFGATITAGSSVWDAIQGSSFADIVINAGQITGFVQLGEGDDTFVQRFSGSGSSATIARIIGGGGTDTLRIEGVMGVINTWDQLFDVERVVVAGGGVGGTINLVGLTGVSTIEALANVGLNVVDANSPNAAFTINGGYTGLSGASTVRSVTGSAGADNFTLNGSINGMPQVTQGINLGGGDDTFHLQTDFLASGAIAIAAPIDLGAGRDFLSIIDRSHDRDIDLAQFSGVEVVTDYGNVGNNALTLRNGGSGLEEVRFADRALTLIGFNAPGASIANYGDVLTISAGSTVGSALAFGNQSLAQYEAFPFLAGIETTLVNNGAILGEVRLGYSSDIYNGQNGSVGGAVYGFAGNDELNGGAGNERFDGGMGADTLNGGGGDDTFVLSTVTLAGERFDGGSGSDTIEARVASDIANRVETSNGAVSQHMLGIAANLASVERLNFVSNFGENISVAANIASFAAGSFAQVTGGAGRDSVVVMTQGAGAFTMPTPVLVNWSAPSINADDPASDTFMLTGDAGPGGSLTLNAAAGFATRQMLQGGASDDTLNGSANADVLDGRGGANQLFGGGGNDDLWLVNMAQPNGVGGFQAPTLFSGAGSLFDGGDGYDTLSIGGFVNFQGTLASIEEIRLLAAFLPTGSAAAMRSAAVFQIDASLLSALPAALVFSGTGDLIINADSAATLGLPQFTIQASAIIDISLIGGDSAQVFTGTAGAETIDGRGGNDYLRGWAGSDTLLGGDGLDNLEGGLGADVLDGGAGFDIASYGNAAAGLRASLASGAVNTGDAAGDVLTGIEGLSGSFFGDDLIGNAATNSLWGAQGEDVLWGQGGADELYGNDGNDWLVGGTGADKLDGGAGWDTVRYSFAATGLRADLQDWWGNTGDAAGDRTYEVEALVGSDWDDLLLGDNGNNELWGDYGADHLWGRGGNDYLAGGNGLDTFHFTAGWGNDIVLDFGIGGAEKLSFDGVAGLTSFAQLTVTSGAGGVTLSFGGNSVLLQGVASIAAGDCIFT